MGSLREFSPLWSCPRMYRPFPWRFRAIQLYVRFGVVLSLLGPCVGGAMKIRASARAPPALIGALDVKFPTAARTPIC